MYEQNYLVKCYEYSFDSSISGEWLMFVQLFENKYGMERGIFTIYE